MNEEQANKIIELLTDINEKLDVLKKTYTDLDDIHEQIGGLTGLVNEINNKLEK